MLLPDDEEKKEIRMKKKEKENARGAMIWFWGESEETMRERKSSS